MKKTVIPVAFLATLALSGCVSGRFAVPDELAASSSFSAPAPAPLPSSSDSASPGVVVPGGGDGAEEGGSPSTPGSSAPAPGGAQSPSTSRPAPSPENDAKFDAAMAEVFTDMYDREFAAIAAEYGVDPKGDFSDAPAKFFTEVEQIGKRISSLAMPIAGGDQSYLILDAPSGWDANGNDSEMDLIYSFLRSMSQAYGAKVAVEKLPSVHFTSTGLFKKIAADPKAVPSWACDAAEKCLSDVKGRIVSTDSKSVFPPSRVNYVRVEFTSGGSSSTWVFGVTSTGPAMFVSSAERV